MTTHRYFRMDDLPPWNTASLVGTYFHSDRERGWQGVIVAEPAPGTYLVELFDWLTGDPDTQRLVTLETMLLGEWSFYDDAQWMRTAYTERVS
jgi:hypothetical protein